MFEALSFFIGNQNEVVIQLAELQKFTYKLRDI